MTVLAILAAFIVGVLVGAGVAIWLYARMIERRATELARQWSETEQHWQRVGRITSEGAGQ